jgi:hypothetical protein
MPQCDPRFEGSHPIASEGFVGCPTQSEPVAPALPPRAFDQHLTSPPASPVAAHPAASQVFFGCPTLSEARLPTRRQHPTTAGCPNIFDEAASTGGKVISGAPRKGLSPFMRPSASRKNQSGAHTHTHTHAHTHARTHMRAHTCTSDGAAACP